MEAHTVGEQKYPQNENKTEFFWNFFGSPRKRESEDTWNQEERIWGMIPRKNVEQEKP